MNIGCVGWGSLLWKPGPLPVASPWQAGGPQLPLEFARVGEQGELAVVICPGAQPMPTRWARLAAANLPAARELLRQREQIPAGRSEWVGSTPGSDGAAADAAIAAWAATRGFDAVVWTAMPPRWDDVDGRPPTADQAVAYLDGLAGPVRAHAEAYIRRVPVDIRTVLRAEIERRLGWLPTPAPGSTT